MAEVRLTPEDIGATGGFADQTSDTLRAAISGFSSEFDGFVGSRWSGQAAAAYASEFASWLEGAGKVADALSTMAELLMSAAARFTDIEEDNAGALGQLRPDPVDIPLRLGVDGYGR